jgi:Protein of unknown function (DUF2490)
MKNLLGAAALVVLAPVTADAAADDLQQWSTISVQGKLADGVIGAAEVVARFTDDVGRLGQLEMRAAVGHPVSKAITLYVGYVHTVTYAKVGRDGMEEGVFQQLNWNMGRVLGGALSSRTRFEQRFQRGVSDVALRVRSQVKLSVPLKDKGPNFVVSVEPFVSLNSTDAVRSGLDQVRSFAGVGFRVSKRAEIDVGYLNQYLNRPSGDRSNHAISVSLGFKL